MAYYLPPTFADYTPDSKVHGTNMGPTWVLLAPDGPHVGPINITIRDVNKITGSSSYTRQHKTIIIHDKPYILPLLSWLMNPCAIVHTYWNLAVALKDAYILIMDSIYYITWWSILAQRGYHFCLLYLSAHISYFVFVFWHMQLYMSWYIISFFGFIFTS